ncbi:tRNA preQ1(34) S-adenosylmethionine ribosyltransferase-isomerase QueA [Candidatus Gracilibacteria bacterium]|nr:tRNA preQ1(34) S-adenosylmethionine ribosyltransferase-isomerase QueA [Candidatus Gracilibacteria bacterium]
MLLSDFDYHLPEDLIAQTPIEPRDHSRLLKLNASTGEIKEDKFYSILDELNENDVLVLNKTRVINARLHGKNDYGRGVEIFLHKQVSEDSWDCLIFPGKKLKPGRKVTFEFGLEAVVQEYTEEGRIMKFNKSGIDFLKTIEKLGEIPMPPYIKEKLENSERYQTIWSEIEGSVAAPTASLHFTNELIQKIKDKGVKIEKVLLHVGLGTFMAVKSDNILEHKMHSEYIELEEDVANRLNKYKSEGKRIIAIGTTSIRVLETMSDKNGIIHSGNKETDIFIYPGYKWKFVDAMITNFHLPKSTLLMLVSSFAGKENIIKAYNYAVKNKFRFFSFGDAMFIKK